MTRIDAVAHFKVGVAHYESGQNDWAKREFERALDLTESPNEHLYTYLGKVSKETGDLEAAIGYFSKALGMSNDSAARLGLGETLLEVDLDQAIAEFERALDASSSGEEMMVSLQNLGEAFARQKEFDFAIQHFEEALRIGHELEGGIPRKTHLGILNGLIRSWLSQGDLERARHYHGQFTALGGFA